MGSMVQNEYQGVREASQPDVSALTYKGKYFTFPYPGEYVIQSGNRSVKWPVLEQQVLAKTDIEGRKISVVVQDITGFALAEYPSFRIRTLDPHTYKKEQLSGQGEDYTLFTKSVSVFEVGAFWQEGVLALSIIISSPTRLEGLREELLELLAHLRPLSE